MRKIFARAAKCATRLPAAQRHALNRNLRSSLRCEPTDSESVDAVIEHLLATLAESPRNEASLTVLRAVAPRSASAIDAQTSTTRLRRCFGDAAILLQEDYSALPAIDQNKVESALVALRNGVTGRFDAADVCRAISSALRQNEEENITPFAHDLITDYVTAIAQIWCQHGLRAARARNPLDAAYRGKFHRFADLVLTSLVDPWSKRHDGDQREMLVSEDHVKKAIERVKKRAPKLRKTQKRASKLRKTTSSVVPMSRREPLS